MSPIDECLATFEDIKGSVDQMLSDNRQLVQTLQDIQITGPDDDGLLWINFRDKTGRASISVRANISAGQVVQRWRDRQMAVLGEGV